ncbi:hypothetical protein C8Q79DRAFT_290752 [Trametes meyenii]|nr:hypothetical protein C8Q79DRAFT_290752 [Trametes meyenii]
MSDIHPYGTENLPVGRGSCLAAGRLYGITTCQAFIYYKRCHKDSVTLKSSVLVLWYISFPRTLMSSRRALSSHRTLDTVHAGLLTIMMYWYCVTNFTDLAAIRTLHWSLPVRGTLSIVKSYVAPGTLRIYGISLLDNVLCQQLKRFNCPHNIHVSSVEIKPVQTQVDPSSGHRRY